MPRPDPVVEYKESLAQLLQQPLIRERFAKLESITVDELAVCKNQDDILELVRMLKIIRSFSSGVASAPQIRLLRDAKFKAVDKDTR